MNSPVRAMSDLKADGAERAPVLLAHSELGRAGIIALERPGGHDALDDIVTSRMKDLADRLAACAVMPAADNSDTSLPQHDIEIQPVTLAAITGLRGQVVADTDDDEWLPAPPVAAIVPTAPVEPAAAVAPPSPPNMSMRSSEEVSEQNLQSLLAVLDPPTPLRLAGELPSRRLVPITPFEDAPTEATEAESETIVVTSEIDTSPAPIDPPWIKPEPADSEPLMLADQSAGDIRLVDLIKRQQTLLEQLNHYPPAPMPADAPAEPPAAATPPRSLFDQLAPTPPMIPSEPRRAPAAEAPPPLPSTGVLRLAAPSPEDAEHVLPERAPMIIERARAERSGQSSGKSATAPSPLPAFAAGIAIAIAIAGSLLFVL